MDDGRSFKDRLSYFCEIDDGLAANLLRAAEAAFDDRPSALVALRALAEGVARTHLMPIASRVRGRKPDLAELVQAIRDHAIAPPNVCDTLDMLRIAGNFGAHPEFCRDPPQSTLELIRAGWDLAAWLYLRNGGTPHKVPSFEPPTASDGNSVFRDAVLGGPEGSGDPVAKFHVAKAILAQHAAKMRHLRESDGGIYSDRQDEAIALMQGARHYVPAARSAIAELILMKSSPNDEEVKEGLDLLEWAVEDDDPEGLFLLGYFHRDGLHGKAIDPARAVELWERAAVQEDPRAFNALAIMYRDGIVVPQDAERARDYARRSAEAGFPIGQHVYGDFLIDGFGGPADKAAGLMWLRRAIQQDWPSAMFHLAKLLLDGTADPGPDEDAEQLLTAACRLHCSEALVWRADRESQKPDRDVDFGRVLGDLGLAQEGVAGEERIDLGKKQQAAYRRLESHILALPKTSKRRQDLSFMWSQFNSDGTPKYRDRIQAASAMYSMFSMERGPDGRDRMTDDSMRKVIRSTAGPGLSDAELEWGLMEMRRRLDAEDAVKAEVAVPKVGRNEQCPCGSGKKYKKCHGN